MSFRRLGRTRGGQGKEGLCPAPVFRSWGHVWSDYRKRWSLSMARTSGMGDPGRLYLLAPPLDLAVSPGVVAADDPRPAKALDPR